MCGDIKRITEPIVCYDSLRVINLGVDGLAGIFWGSEGGAECSKPSSQAIILYHNIC
jgi:hypothetical protein